MSKRVRIKELEEALAFERSLNAVMQKKQQRVYERELLAAKVLSARCGHCGSPFVGFQETSNVAHTEAPKEDEEAH